MRFNYFSDVCCLTLKSIFLSKRWTGSNLNPPNNDGQGLAGTDRSNIVILNNRVGIFVLNNLVACFIRLKILSTTKKNFTKGDTPNPYKPLNLYGHFGTNFPINLNANTFLGFNRDDLTRMALLETSMHSYKLNQFPI